VPGVRSNQPWLVPVLEYWRLHWLTGGMDIYR
jgi:hypothetical protein